MGTVLTIRGCTEVTGGIGMGKSRVLSEFLQFLNEEKKYWLIPIVVVLVALGVLIAFAQTSVLSPFIYTLF